MLSVIRGISFIVNSLFLLGTFKPFVKIVPDFITSQGGLPVTLTCYVAASPNATITWRRLSGKQLQSTPANDVSGRSVFTIPSLTDDDVDTYICQANNTEGSTEATSRVNKNGDIQVFLFFQNSVYGCLSN